MSLNLVKIRGGDENSLNNKEYTIGVGLSLGNKWFTVENILKSIEWALDHSKNKVVIYVADSIHSINIQVRSRKSHDASLRIAEREGEELFRNIKEAVTSLKQSDQDRLVFVKWDELVDQKFKEKLKYLRSLYATPGPFQERIHSIVRQHTAKENRIFSDADIHTLGSYIIEELPECLNRIPMNGIIVDAYMYPQENQIVELIAQIQNNEAFPEIRKNIFDTENKVLLVVN